MEYKYLKCCGKSSFKKISFIQSFWKDEKTPKKYIGFVYEITNKKTRKRYIGIKRFWKKYTLPPLKGKKRKRHFLKETNWRTYNSSGLIEEEVRQYPKRFEKRILYLCKTITDLKATEAYEQLNAYMDGEWDMLYNEVINLRLRIRK